MRLSVIIIKHEIGLLLGNVNIAVSLPLVSKDYEPFDMDKSMKPMAVYRNYQCAGATVDHALD